MKQNENVRTVTPEELNAMFVKLSDIADELWHMLCEKKLNVGESLITLSLVFEDLRLMSEDAGDTHVLAKFNALASMARGIRQKTS